MPKKVIPATEHGGVVRYALYRRVSSEGQVDRDLSLPEQKAQQHDYVAREGGIIAAEYEDGGISGRTVDARPAFQEMITAAKSGDFDVILVHKSDRAFRNKDEASTYRLATAKLGVRWASVTEKFFGSPEPADKLLTGIMESVSEFFLDNLSAEVRKGIRSAAVSKGRQHGAPPYGYRYADLTQRGSGWVLDEDEAPRVLYLYQQMAQNSLSVAEMCRLASGLGWPAPADPSRDRKERGLPQWNRVHAEGWRQITMKRLLTSRVYLGDIHCQGNWIPGHQPPIVPRELGESVHAMLLRRGQHQAPSRVNVFGGLIRCPVCAAHGFQSVLHIHYQQSQPAAHGTKGPYTNYYCSRHYIARRDKALRHKRQGSGGEVGEVMEGEWACPGFSISDSKFERLLMHLLIGLTGQAMIWTIGKPSPPRTEGLQNADALPALRRDIAAIDTEMRGYDTLFASGRIDLSRYDAHLARLQERRVALESAADRLVSAGQEAPVRPTISPDTAAYLLGVLLSEELTPAQKQDRLRYYVAAFVPSEDKMLMRVQLHPT